MSLPMPFYDQDGCTIFVGDCRYILPHLPKAPKTLLCADPPYGINADKNKRANQQHGKAVAPSRDYGLGNWDGERLDFLPSVLIGDFNIVWGGNYYADILPPTSGWLFWDKDNGNNGYADGELAWTDIPMALRKFRHRWMGMLQENMSEKEFRFHPTQKPVELMRWCISMVPDAQVVLDPFMGVGTTLRAAKDLGRRCIGIEINESYARIAVERLRQGVLNLA